MFLITVNRLFNRTHAHTPLTFSTNSAMICAKHNFLQNITGRRQAARQCFAKHCLLGSKDQTLRRLLETCHVLNYYMKIQTKYPVKGTIIKKVQSTHNLSNPKQSSRECQDNQACMANADNSNSCYAHTKDPSSEHSICLHQPLTFFASTTSSNRF